MVDKKLFVKNSLSGLVQKIIIAIITFLAIPIFIRTKGAQIYGIFATIGVLGELGRLTELGFNKTLVKFLSNQGRTKESAQDILVATLVILSLLIPLTVSLYFLKDFVLLRVLKIPVAELHQSQQFYFFAIAANAMLLLGSIYSSVIESQRFIYKISILQLVYSVLYWGLIIIALLTGFGLREVGISIFIAAFVWFVLTIMMMRYIWGKFDFNGFTGYAKKSFKKLTNYSLKVYVSSLLGFFEEPLIKIMVSNFFGISYVGFLDIGIRIKSQLYRLLQPLIYPLFQLFSELKDKASISTIMRDIEEKLFLLMTPLCIGIITCTSPFINLWLGTGESSIILSVIFISVGALLFQLTVLPTVYYLTIYHPVTLVFTQVIGIFLNILIVYVGHFFIGFASVYIGFTAYYTTNLLLRLYYQKKYLNCVLFAEEGYFLRFLRGMTLLAVVSSSLSFLLRHNHILSLTVTAISILIMTFVIYKYFRLITREDFNRYSIFQVAKRFF